MYSYQKCRYIERGLFFMLMIMNDHVNVAARIRSLLKKQVQFFAIV